MKPIKLTMLELASDRLDSSMRPSWMSSTDNAASDLS